MSKKKDAILKFYAHVVFIILGIASFSAGHALNGDRQQPIVIKSQSAQVDLSSNNFVLQGDVSITQGSLHIHGSQVKSTKTASNNLLEITGHPAFFRQILESRNAQQRHRLFSGCANSIKYNKSSGLITLSGQVNITLDNDKLSGSKMVYDSKQERYQLFSSKKQQARLIIYP